MLMDLDLPDLDNMEAPELRAFYHKYKTGRKYLELFPKGGEGTINETIQLSEYARLKALAVSARLKGKIWTAQQNEAKCEEIYQALPVYIRW